MLCIGIHVSSVKKSLAHSGLAPHPHSLSGCHPAPCGLCRVKNSDLSSISSIVLCRLGSMCML
jgi:hypothetical protein